MSQRATLRHGYAILRYIGGWPLGNGQSRAFARRVRAILESGVPCSEPQVDWVPLDAILAGAGEVRVCLSHKVEAKGLPYGEALVIAQIAATLHPRNVFEIGTFTGATTLLLAENGGPECQVHTLDLGSPSKALRLEGDPDDPPEMDHERIGQHFRGTPQERQITQHYGDSASFDFSQFAGRMDLVLVDGSHSYEYVLNDTRAALTMVAPGGLVVWDDCDDMNPGVLEALSEVSREVDMVRIVTTRLACYRKPA